MSVRQPSSSSKRGRGPHVCNLCGYGAATQKSLLVHEGGRACKQLSLRRSRKVYSKRVSGPVTPPSPSSSSSSSSDADDVSGNNHNDDDDDDDDDENGVDAQDGRNKRARLPPPPSPVPRVDVMQHLLDDMTALSAAVAYEKPRQDLVRLRADNAQTRARVDALLHNELAAQRAALAKVDEALGVYTMRARPIVIAQEAIDASQALLRAAREERAQCEHVRTQFVDVAGPATRQMASHVAALNTNLPAGVKVCFALDVYYEDESGRVEPAALIDRIIPSLRDDTKRADDKITEALAIIFAHSAILQDAKEDEARALRDLDVAREVLATQRTIVEKCESELATIVTEGERFARAEDEFIEHERKSTGAFGTLSLSARTMVAQLRASPEHAKALCGTFESVASYFV